MCAEVTVVCRQPMICMNFFEIIKTERWKGVMGMAENKDMKKDQESKKKKTLTKSGDIKGKIEVPDTRERRDGPGGN